MARRNWKHYASLTLAVLTCPCHLPLLLGMLAGTAVGGWLSQYSLAVFLAMLGFFVFTLLYSFRALGHRKVWSDTLPNHGAGNNAIAGRREASRVVGE